jgi:hypothetical protein
MRSVAEYMNKAAEFDGLADRAAEPSLKIKYADLAQCYRLLANERKRLVDEGIILTDAPKISN